MPRGNKKVIEKARSTSVAIREMIDLLDGQVSKAEILILDAAYLILHLIGVWGPSSRISKQ